MYRHGMGGCWFILDEIIQSGEQLKKSKIFDGGLTKKKILSSQEKI